jgi:hypothetical protein
LPSSSIEVEAFAEHVVSIERTPLVANLVVAAEIHRLAAGVVSAILPERARVVPGVQVIAMEGTHGELCAGDVVRVVQPAFSVVLDLGIELRGILCTDEELRARDRAVESDS